MQKHILDPKRLRRVPARFSWVDHRLISHRLLCGADSSAWALYLFLVSVGDEQGLSYYSDASVCSHLNLSGEQLPQARRQLLERTLIAWEAPLYQVLGVQASDKTSGCGADGHTSVAVSATLERSVDKPPAASAQEGQANSLHLARALAEIMKGGKQ
jgi:hypothetical protein